MDTIVKDLKAFIDVDIFGRCGKPCPTHYKNNTYGCKEIISKEYKFYFSFENSVCTEYITEKFFETLKFNIIPVVLGGGNYDLYVSSYKILLKMSKMLNSTLVILSKNWPC